MILPECQLLAFSRKLLATTTKRYRLRAKS